MPEYLVPSGYVRRLLIFVEQSIDRGIQWVVFEPNSEPTWIAVHQSITNFLRTVWRSGALMGTTQEEAFFVRCDRTTMTQDDIDNGRLIGLIGIAPVKPAEFVICRISQKTIEAENTLTSFNSIVDIHGMRAGFSEVEGLDTASDVLRDVERSEDIAVRKLPGKRKYTSITLKRGYTRDAKELWAWRKKVMDGKTQRLAGAITLLNEAHRPALTWEFSDCWPSKWEGPALHAKNNEVAIEEMEICVEGLVLRT